MVDLPVPALQLKVSVCFCLWYLPRILKNKLLAEKPGSPATEWLSFRYLVFLPFELAAFKSQRAHALSIL